MPATQVGASTCCGHTAIGPGWQVPDLACGKGAVRLAEMFGCAATGIDIVPALVVDAAG